MSIVKYDNELRDKIEGMKDVPSAFTFNATAKWQQLENKLQPAPNKKKLVWWYWAAAAAFIVFSSLLWLKNAKQIDVAIVSNSPKIFTPQTTKSIHQNAIVKQFQKQENSSLKTIQTSTNITEATNIASDTIELINKATMVESNVIVADIAVKNIADTVVQKNNIKTQVATVKPKRKVIHIYELSEVITQPVLLTRNEHKQIPEQEDNTTPVESNKSWWLFKAKQTNVNTLTNTSLTDNQ